MLKYFLLHGNINRILKCVTSIANRQFLLKNHNNHVNSLGAKADGIHLKHSSLLLLGNQIFQNHTEEHHKLTLT